MHGESEVGVLSRETFLHDHVTSIIACRWIGPRILKATPAVSGTSSDSHLGFITVEGNAGITGLFPLKHLPRG